MTTDGIAPGERRELRSVVRGQFKVLRAEVKRRKQELVSEVEDDLLYRFRDQDARIQEAKRAVARISRDAVIAAEKVLEDLLDDPDISGRIGFSYNGGLGLSAESKSREQLRRAAHARIPNIVGDAELALDRQEVELLRTLSEGALESTSAREFLSSIPTVGQLVPRARIAELTADMEVKVDR